MGNYMLNLKHKAELSAQRMSSGTAVAPPVATPAEPISLYVAYDDLGVLRQRATTTQLPRERTARAREILRALLAQYLQAASPHPLGEGSDVNNVFIVNNSLAVIDLNNAFVAGHRSGVLEEALTVDSIVATLAANMPNITRIKFLVNGKERETLAGHADLISIYDVTQVNQLVKDLQ